MLDYYALGKVDEYGVDILGESIGVDAAHGDAECAGLEDIMVGEALDQLGRD